MARKICVEKVVKGYVMSKSFVHLACYGVNMFHVTIRLKILLWVSDITKMARKICIEKRVKRYKVCATALRCKHV
jgi:hypothetical protein